MHVFDTVQLLGYSPRIHVSVVRVEGVLSMVSLAGPSPALGEGAQSAIECMKDTISVCVSVSPGQLFAQSCAVAVTSQY